MNKANEYFKHDIKNILNNGYMDENPRPKYKDGTPAHTLSVNQVVRTYDLSKGEYPISTFRQQAWKSAIKEILWIYQDQSNNLDLLNNKYKVKYWNSWDIGDRTIGIRYGETVRRHYNIKNFIEELKDEPFARRHIIDLYQVDDFKGPGLNPCAFLTMWNVRKSNDRMYIDMTLVQRSVDMIVASGAGGLNEIQYCAFMLMICKATGYLPGVFAHFVQNEQIYDRHVDLIDEILTSEKNEELPPRLILDTDETDFFKFTVDDFTIINYPELSKIDLELGI